MPVPNARPGSKFSTVRSSGIGASFHDGLIQSPPILIGLNWSSDALIQSSSGRGVNFLVAQSACLRVESMLQDLQGFQSRVFRHRTGLEFESEATLDDFQLGARKSVCRRHRLTLLPGHLPKISSSRSSAWLSLALTVSCRNLGHDSPSFFSR